MRSKEPTPEPPSYSVAETAAVLGESKYRVRTMTTNGTLAAFTRGGNCRIPVEAVEDYILERDGGGVIDVAANETGPTATSLIRARVRELYGDDRLFLSVEETATVLQRFSVRVVRDAINRGQIPSRKIGERRWVLVADLDGWLRGEAA